MFPKPKNERLAIGTFVGVLAIDAVLGGSTGQHPVPLFIVFAINLPATLVGSGILCCVSGIAVFCFGHVIDFEHNDSFNVILRLSMFVGAIFNAAMWSVLFGYAWPFKRAA